MLTRTSRGQAVPGEQGIMLQMTSHSALPGMVRIPNGSFSMGLEDFYPEERPVRRVAVDGFWMDERPVTAAEFRSFVRDTGYVTLAERPLDPTDYPSRSA
jgi:sulfatase modifying factor 1